MKKALLITLIALMSCMLMTTALAADFTTPGEYVKHVSFDEIRPGIVVAGDDALKNTPTFASGTTELTFWGWAVVGDRISPDSLTVSTAERRRRMLPLWWRPEPTLKPQQPALQEERMFPALR